jgi:hypothetical protein
LYKVISDTTISQISPKLVKQTSNTKMAPKFWVWGQRISDFDWFLGGLLLEGKEKAIERRFVMIFGMGDDLRVN